jgi:hypothetical protein
VASGGALPRGADCPRSATGNIIILSQEREGMGYPVGDVNHRPGKGQKGAPHAR